MKQEIQNKITNALQWLDRVNYRACEEIRDVIYAFVKCHFIDDNGNLKLDNAKGYEYQIALYIHFKTQPPYKIKTMKLYEAENKLEKG